MKYKYRLLQSVGWGAGPSRPLSLSSWCGMGLLCIIGGGGSSPVVWGLPVLPLRFLDEWWSAHFPSVLYSAKNV